MMKQYTSFRKFLLDKYLKDDGSKGDFARDVKQDETFPRNVKDGYEIKWYLERHNACDDCIECFNELWYEYKNIYYKGCLP